MTKKVRIKQLEGYTKDLERRIETLEGKVKRLNSWTRLSLEEQATSRKALLGYEKMITRNMTGVGASTHDTSQWLTCPDPKTARFFTSLIRHIREIHGSSEPNLMTCDQCLKIDSVLARWS